MTIKIEVKIPHDLRLELDRETIEFWLGRLGNSARNEAIKGIARTAKSGRVYKVGKLGRLHQASAPGEYPATNKGLLVNSFNVKAKGLTMVFGNSAPYAGFLEKGTGKMAPRPFLGRSFDKAFHKTNVPQGIIKLKT